MQQVNQGGRNSYKTNSPGLKKQDDLQSPKEKVAIEDFVLISVIGKGSYAKVSLVKKKDSKEVFALKVLKKEYIEKKKQEEHIITERNVLAEVKHPFIVKMFYSFQNDRKLFFVLEYCPGGELFHLLTKKKQFTEDQTRFFAAQIVLALEHLHARDIIYRDLKPENVLIDQIGYIRITDFGLSKRKVKGTKDAHSVCGTPEYLAPEIILKVGHGKAVDWWTLGSLIYELLTGLPPFYTSNREQLFEKIKTQHLQYPTHLTSTCKNLLDGLFQKVPEKRLGWNGAFEIKDHPWFLSVNWETLMRKEYKAPFIPVIKSEADVSNFDREFTEQPIDSYCSNSLQSNDKIYENFTYCSDDEKF